LGEERDGEGPSLRAVEVDVGQTPRDGAEEHTDVLAVGEARGDVRRNQPLVLPVVPEGALRLGTEGDDLPTPRGVREGRGDDAGGHRRVPRRGEPSRRALDRSALAAR